jgi:hypothetical protein
MQNQSRTFTAVLSAAAVIFTLLYGLYLFGNVQLFADYDQVAYYGNIEAAIEGWTPVYNPHHLHFEIFGKHFHQFMVSNFGDAGFTDLAFNLRIRSVITAAAGFFFFVLFFGHASRSVFFGIVGAAAVGFSHGYIHYATKIDTSIFPAAAFALILSAFLYFNKTRRSAAAAAIILGISFFIGIMMHQYTVIASAVIGFVCLLPDMEFIQGFGRPFLHLRRSNPKIPGNLQNTPRRSSPSRFRRPRLEGRYRLRVACCLLAALVGIGLTVGAYLWVGRGIYNLHYAGDSYDGKGRGIWRGTTFQRWLFAYEMSDSWGRGLETFKPWQPARGLTDSFLTQYEPHLKYSREEEFDYDIDDLSSREAFAFNLLAYFFFFTIAASILLFPVLLRRYGRTFLALILMIPPYFIFFTYWEPFYFEFWLLPAIIIIALGVLIFNWAGELTSRILRLPVFLGKLPLLLLFAGLTFTFANHNIENYVIPYTQTKHQEGVDGLDAYRYLPLFSDPVYRENHDRSR